MHYLNALGVTHVVLDATTLTRERLTAVRTNDRLQLMSSDGIIWTSASDGDAAGNRHARRRSVGVTRWPW